jgi:hypothetical protein
MDDPLGEYIPSTWRQIIPRQLTQTKALKFVTPNRLMPPSLSVPDLPFERDERSIVDLLTI